MQADVSLRPRQSDDDPRIVAIHADQEADSAPLTVERYRAEHDEPSPGDRTETWVAVRDGGVVGFGGFFPAWWMGDPAAFSLDLRVDRPRWRQGIGTRLLDLLRSRLEERGARTVLCWVRADAPHGMVFAAHHGFSRTGQEIEEYRLFVPDANTPAYAGVEERLRESGIRIASLAEMVADRVFLRRLQALWGEGEASTPEERERSFDVWRSQVLESPGLSPETHWVALDGDRPVGTTFLKRLSADAAENDYTAVALSHRRRGIAPALKLQAIAWARHQGVRWFYTSSEVGNSPMLSINRRLGYRPGAHRVEMARDLR